jgi:membrane carboxypeptidase/penicillin-binding protein PbpC
MGNFDGRPMRDTFAVRSATPLWATMMRELLRHDQPLDQPVENENLMRRDVCADTGLLPSRFTGSTISEWFPKGTEPKQDSSDWFDNDGKLLLPAQYAAWCASSNNMRGAIVRPEARITSPIANAHYEIDSALPRSQQMIELTTTLGRDVQWFVNDAQQSPQSDGRVFWPLTSGEWKLRAVGRVATIEETISVE